jgi:hypothetical protein
MHCVIGNGHLDVLYMQNSGRRWANASLDRKAHLDDMCIILPLRRAPFVFQSRLPQLRLLFQFAEMQVLSDVKVKGREALFHKSAAQQAYASRPL